MSTELSVVHVWISLPQTPSLATTAAAYPHPEVLPMCSVQSVTHVPYRSDPAYGPLLSP